MGTSRIVLAKVARPKARYLAQLSIGCNPGLLVARVPRLKPRYTI